MNEDTRIAVCCYAGDQQQVEQSLDLYTHHQCPVVMLSPEDAPVNISGVENRHAGKRAQLGPDAHARHLAHLKILLTYPENHFLMHESDSFCLDLKIPDYLYAEPDIVWANIGDATADHHPGFPPGCPPLSFQAPWFLSRKTIEAFVAVADQVVYHPNLEWVDLYLVQLTHAAGLPWRAFRDRCLCPMSGCYDTTTGLFFDPGQTSLVLHSRPRGIPLDATMVAIYEEGLKIGLREVAKGANMVHSVKNVIAARALMEAYRDRH